MMIELTDKELSVLWTWMAVADHDGYATDLLNHEEREAFQSAREKLLNAREKVS